MLSNHLVRSVLESAPDAIIIIDSAGSILFASQQTSALFGYEANELLGRAIECLLPERYRVRHVEHRSRYFRSGRIRPMGSGLDLFARRKDASEFPVEISLSPVSDGERALVAAVIRDVTERRLAEIELKAAREAAERASLAKSRFLATASHDLRQPLQTLSLLNGGLRRMINNPSVAEVLAQQEQAIGAMSRLLNALLDMSKLESGAIRPELTDFNVASLFDEMRTEFAGLAANKGLELHVEPCAEFVHSDVSLVGQILRNLVSNAIKYTREGWVRLRCLREQANVRLEVLDTGIGIAPDQLALIFDEFYQIGTGSGSSRDGYGLGLSIVQRLAQLLDLKLDVRSQLGKGSAFALELPASARPSDRRSGRPAAVAADRLNGARPSVLLVEDDPAVRDATRMLLKVEGYRVIMATSLEEARSKAQEDGPVDLLVCDCHLNGEETGTQVIAALRAMHGNDLKAVLMTGDTSLAVSDLHRDPNLRIANKPIDADQLVELLGNLLAS